MVSLVWNAPDFLGYYKGKDATVIEYTIEALRNGSDWQEMAQLVDLTVAVTGTTSTVTVSASALGSHPWSLIECCMPLQVHNLEQYSPYQFRVAGINEVGVGNFSDATNFHRTGVFGGWGACKCQFLTWSTLTWHAL